ncbi:MAG TPA: winged helix-turn-helix domain-containing protein, partial [Anaerolineae bacterium]|nr:winged helix-turn-helix domain-containing protein [Anaerolineae bacterium]
MAIPDYQSIMLPLLKYASDGKEHSLRETIEALADEFQLTDDERRNLLPSGQQTIFDNRVGWARTYLKKAGLLETTRRGYYRITKRGQDVLRQNLTEINTAYLKQFAEFIEFQSTHRNRVDESDDHETAETRTPEEEIEAAYQRVRERLAAELLQTVKGLSPV